MFGKNIFKELFDKNILKWIGLFFFIVIFGTLISSNVCHADGLVINEIVARDPYGGNDWIEFFVTGSNSVYLGDYKVVDDNEAHGRVSLPGITLGPGEFIVIQATSEDPGDGSYYVPFGLGSDDALLSIRDRVLWMFLTGMTGTRPVVTATAGFQMAPALRRH